MQDLKELVYILNQHHLNPLNPNGQPMERDSLLWQFFVGIGKGHFHTDEEAEAQLYPGDQGGSKYRKLKSVLRDRLLNSIALFTAHGTEFTDYQKAYYECHKQWLVVKILTGQNANTAAMGLATKLMKQSEKYEFTMLAMDIASYLRIQYGLRESNDKKFREVNELFEINRKIYDAECLAEEYYTLLVVKTVNSRTVSEEASALASEYYDKIEPLLREYRSYRLHLYGRMIGLMRYTAVNDYENALPYCDDSIAFFRGKPYESKVPLQIFYYQKLICHIQLRHFEEGRDIAQYCLGIMSEGTFNWFKYMELYLQLSWHTQQFEQGTKVLQDALQHPRFQFLPDNAKEIWRIFESYGYYLGAMGKIGGFPKSKFKLGKFINETPIFAKDKSGMNIAIIVIKWLYLLSERKYSQLLDEVESTEQYGYRYLNGKNTVRSYNFVKMLLQIPMGQFDRAVIEKRTERYRKKLEETPLQIANQTHEIEIIPYEILWEMAMESVSGHTERGNNMGKTQS